MLSREEAAALVQENVKKRNVIYHMLAVEAVMRSLAKHFGEDAETWGLVGLLHDIDYERTETTPEKHSLVADEILRGLVSADIMRAIKAHNQKHTGVSPETRMERALVASDAISGLLIACTLVIPSQKLADVKTESVAKKFRDKDFARGADRERILVCEQLGLPKEQFFQIALDGLKAIGSEIGL